MFTFDKVNKNIGGGDRNGTTAALKLGIDNNFVFDIKLNFNTIAAK